MQSNQGSFSEAAFCGDYCGKCPNYPGKCAGCIPSLHADCHFVKCCLEKQIEHCGLCDQFPCQKLIEFVPDNRPGCPPGYHIENLRLRTSVSTDCWLELQRSRWSQVVLAELFLLNAIVAGERYIRDGLVAAAGVHFWSDVVWHVIFPLM